ncbi:MAG: hypothetical protein GY835_23405 [bacterium]|nr:hypothetical protein [bacterium]
MVTFRVRIGARGAGGHRHDRRRLPSRHLPSPMELPADPLAATATAAMTARIEEQIRCCPEQWVWMHRRWRRRPPEDGTKVFTP